MYRSMRGSNLLAAALVIAGLLSGGFAHAAQQGITGKKLLLKTAPKLILLSKDALVVPGANGSSSDPRCVADGGSGSGVTITLTDAVSSGTLSMPCQYWSANAAGTMYKYKNTTTTQDGFPKTAKIKAGLLKVVNNNGNGGHYVPNGPATVNVEVTVGTDKYCMAFTGTGGGGTFLVKDAAAGTCPGGGAVCGNNVTEGAEQCDGTDDGACPGLCQGDCTCSAGTPCANDFPTCGGTCPPGFVCGFVLNDPWGCQCVADGACGNQGGVCGGACPVGQVCYADLVLGNCGCAQEPVCSGYQYPVCGGDCPAGMSCLPITWNGGNFCVCL